MSANLDLVRSIHARWERGDYSSAPSWADPEMELVFDLGHMRSEGASLYHVRGGKVVRNVFYLDRARALADLGLEA